MNDISRLLAERPHLFSSAKVTIRQADVTRMAALVAAVERVVALPAYQAQVLADAPPVARHAPHHHGVFYGYDFHLTAQGPQLIEINTNAGGGLLAAWRFGRDDVIAAYIAMFRAECPALKTLALVDETPAQQYLYPEFLLFQELFAHHGIAAHICAPEDLSLRQGKLWQGETAFDLVYNRLTDFFLAAEHSAALRDACLENAAVVTPHPHGYALYADKRNLVLFTDDALLTSWQIDEATRQTLTSTIPRTERVSADKADDLWARRKELFFKPATGFGAKAAYRGDKITKRVFEAALAADTIAQTFAPPSFITVDVDGTPVELKADIRCYVYRGAIQFIAARLWQGQTTNFRTTGGGFAEVVIV